MGLFKKVGKMVGMNTVSNTIKKAVKEVAKVTSHVTTSHAKTSQPSNSLIRPVKKILHPEDKFKLFNSADLQKFTNPNFENYSRKFANSEPEVICVAEYFVDDKSIGALIVWERFLDATHYEVFKKNIFQADSKFERILFLDAASLDEETAHFMPYLRDTVGLDIEEDKVFVILDTVVKEDRIYEYKIKAARVPKKATEVDYDFILQSKNLTKSIAIDQSNSSTIFDFAGVTLGSRGLAWTISILNETVPFFGRGALEKALVQFELEEDDEGEEFVLVANNLNDILSVINDSIALFGIKNTFAHVLKVLGGLGSDFRNTFIESIDETRNVFSYDNFRETIKKKVPIYSLVLQVSQSGNSAAVVELSKLDVVIPSKTGSETLSSIENITNVISFVNDLFIAMLYSQDNSAKIREILQKVKSGELKSSPSTDAAAKSLSTPATKSSASSSSSSTKITTKGSSAAVGAPESSSTKSGGISTTSPAGGPLAKAAQAAKNAASNAAANRNAQQNAANKAKSKAAKEKADKEKEDRNKKIKIYF